MIRTVYKADKDTERSSTKSSSDENQSDSQPIEVGGDHVDPSIRDHSDLSTVDYQVNHRPMKALVETSRKPKKS